MANGFRAALEELAATQVILIADENTARLCSPHIDKMLGGKPIIILPPGEENKTLENCEQLWTRFIQNGLDRGSVVITLGGGMVGDLGGFAASCYHRGIRYVQIPTSLLAMVDSSIGGKTGIDFQGYKNVLGRIEPAAFTWIDPIFLDTLPLVNRYDGYAEIMKHAIIGSAFLWDAVSNTSWERLDWAEILYENAFFKSRIVEEDLFEKGLRKILNFGHTIGHALESHYLGSESQLTHGQAVVLGMLAELQLSSRLGILPETYMSSIVKIIEEQVPPVRIAIPTFAVLEKWFHQDKKKHGGQFRFSLPSRVGHCEINIPASGDEINHSLIWLDTWLHQGHN